MLLRSFWDAFDDLYWDVLEVLKTPISTEDLNMKSLKFQFEKPCDIIFVVIFVLAKWKIRTRNTQEKTWIPGVNLFVAPGLWLTAGKKFRGCFLHQWPWLLLVSSSLLKFGIGGINMACSRLILQQSMWHKERWVL